MKLLVGLGNPGLQYAMNRHNVGFMVIDYLAQEYKTTPFKLKNDGEIAEGKIGPHKVLFLKPQKYMNASGPVVNTFAKFYKVAPEDVIVFYDELDLPFGQIKLKIGGGAGGHNGLRSIDTHFHNNTTRVRIGISHPGHKELVTGHVLGNFNKAEIEVLPDILETLDTNLPNLLDDHTDLFRTNLAQDLKALFKN